VVGAIVTAVRDGRLPAARLSEAAARVDELVQQLANRSAPPNDSAVDEHPVDPNLVAARRALHLQAVTGIPPLAGAVVVEFDVTPGIAAGPVPWGLAGPLARFLPGIEGRGADRDSSLSVAEHLQAGTDRPLIAVVRDAHRHPWVADQLSQLALARPDLVTVETGWPVVDQAGTPTGLPGTTTLWTYGGSAVSLRAAAELLIAPAAPATPATREGLATSGTMSPQTQPRSHPTALSTEPGGTTR
jgi:beta-N-acetylhexosaminidase